MAQEQLTTYNEKRDFSRTAEPKGKASARRKNHLEFVVQWHHARRTHYDFRLEWNGVMKSWAVTKGPSFYPNDRRLSVRTEDHPMSYNSFEGVIPEGEYGGGPVMIWDQGTWVPDDDPDKMERKGHISFTLGGERLKGHWALVRMKTKDKRENWLLIKGKDDYALSKTKNVSFFKENDTSIVSGRTIQDIEAGKAVMPAKKSKKKNNKEKSASIASLLKKYGKPELATLVDEAPDGKDWIHEIKYDGYRLMAFLSNGEVVLRTRGMKDWTHKFKTLASSLAKLPVDTAVLDLEACVVDAHGRTDFSTLQEALSEGESERIEAWIFDLLYVDEEDYSKRPLVERKRVLEAVLQKTPKNLHYSAHFESSPDLLTKACKLGAEGLISKRRDSIYQARRTTDWVKSKCGLEQEFVIGGFVLAKDNPKAIGSLLLGYYKGKKLHYAGKVGTGFTRKVATDLFKTLKPLTIDKPLFDDDVARGARKAYFVKPEALCQVAFLEWTRDGHIRHASFKGIREDKPPTAVTEELPKKISKTSMTRKKRTSSNEVRFQDVIISHPDRVVYPGEKITKGDVAAYYDRIAPLMMPFLQNRLVSLLRCTDGISEECFFQRNLMQGMSDQIQSKSLTRKGKKHTYLYTDTPQGLLQLAQMGTVEFHAWQSHVATVNKPDQIIFDLDPDEAVPFEAVKLAAEDVRRRLKKNGLRSFPRLTGGKGIHVVAPFKPDHGWDEVKEFARGIAEDMQSDVPAAYVATMTKAKRKGKIFIDFFRNDFSATAIVPFSLRARKDAPIAWPLSWAALEKQDSASAFRLKNIDQKAITKAKGACDEFLKTDQVLKL